MLRDSTVVVVAVVRTRPRAIPLAKITMRKSTHGFPFASHIWVAYGAPLGGPWGRRSSALNTCLFVLSNLHEIVIWKEKNSVITSENEKFLLSVGVTTGDCEPAQVRPRRPNKNIIRNIFKPKQTKKKKK